MLFAHRFKRKREADHVALITRRASRVHKLAARQILVDMIQAEDMVIRKVKTQPPVGYEEEIHSGHAQHGTGY